MRGALAALATAWAGAVFAASPSHNFTSLWWNAAESGWGLNLTHQGDVIFGTLFTYDNARNPAWYILSEGRLQPGTNDPAADLGAYAGTLYRTTGPAFNANPFTPIGPGNVTRVGDMRVAFGSQGTTLEYDIEGVRVTKPLTRQSFGVAPAACTASLGSRSGFTNYQDLWWNPAESGWGLNVTHQGDVIFATLFTYGLDGRPAWYLMSRGEKRADGSYAGDLYRTTGSPFNAAPFVPLSAADVTRVGGMSLTFSNGETGTLRYDIEGIAVTKAISRQVFGAAQSVCTSPAPPPASGFTNTTAYSTASAGSVAVAPETTVSSRRQITLAGVPLAYTATVGHLNTAGVQKASMFYAAYTLDGAAAANRPVTFIYNGGPGNATVWLHLGSFGPKRLATGMPATDLPMPYALVDNAESLLDVTDLVFVDAPVTGYSTAIAPATNGAFLNVTGDAAIFNDFVARYVAVNDRRASPKYLMGESYGGIRAAVMARGLEAAGIRLAGLILVSPILDYTHNCEVAAVPCTGQVATIAAAASWHGIVPAVPHDEMRMFANHDYDPAAAAFIANGTPVPGFVLDRLVATSGIARSEWAANPNRSSSYFRTNLLPGMLVGRYDARVKIPRGNLPALDPSTYLIDDSFDTRIGEYLASLGYTTPTPYALYGEKTFSLAYAGRSQPDVVPDLAAVLDINPRLKVIALAGYHDLATPFMNTERDLARLGARPGVRVRNYDGGHMIYLDDASRVRLRSDLVQFYLMPVSE
ncbi:hypothetical protein DSM104443_01875 [Usitatibacter rugosus]|uniref:Carboxypeptidase C (Cathepsin A) n=1 Tax=Usitatibacter rugosus TaxID=2732067 RepID=A0A6M4GUJ8_9PROT|nr:hypothetical protein [Usitatibacter rugosus]QJR10806.1 hypothetical protein DSM104443_01875 [Usitatibacter rugosus]